VAAESLRLETLGRRPGGNELLVLRNRLVVVTVAVVYFQQDKSCVLIALEESCLAHPRRNTPILIVLLSHANQVI